MKVGKPPFQVSAAAKKGNQVLGQLLRAFTYRDKTTYVRLYTMYVRPHLEYAIQAWSPYLQQDIDILEKVQLRVVRQISGLSGDYPSMLKSINLPSLADHRLHGDMIQTFKIIHRLDNVNPDTWFVMRCNQHHHGTRLATDPLSLHLPPSNTALRKNFFSVWVVNNWNQLPLSLRSSKTTNEFKNGYNRLFHPPPVCPPPLTRHQDGPSLHSESHHVIRHVMDNLITR